MTNYPDPYQPAQQRWAAGARRELTVAVGEARVVLLQAIRALGFSTTSEQYSLIEAERGSRLRGLSLTRTRVPVALRIGITPDGTGCQLEIKVQDRWGATARSRAAVAVYADVFTEVLAKIDDALKRVDPNSAATFTLWWRNLPDVQAAVGGSAASTAARVESAVQRRTSRILDGPRTAPQTAVAEAGVAAVTFAAPESSAQIAADVVDGMLTAGQLVAASPGTMPPSLVAQVQAMVVLLEERLSAMSRGGAQGDLALYISSADRPVITFLYQQAALRERLPVRLLMSCTTCRLEKVVNPDFVRLRERNRRIKVLSSSVGAVFGTHQVSPFILIGRLSQVKKSDPDFVCIRCQGTDADERPITFCPKCGDRRTESVLGKCPKCELDLRTLLPGLAVWREIEAAPPAPGAATADAEPPAAESPVAPVAAGEQPLAPDSVVPAAPPTPAAATWSAPPAAGPQAWAPPGGWAPSPTPAPSTPHQVAGAPAPPATSPYSAASRKRGHPTNRTSAGWHPDPWRRFELRYFDGQQWTAHVWAAGTATIDTPTSG
jgi:hypothetical protein